MGTTLTFDVFMDPCPSLTEKRVGSAGSWMARAIEWHKAAELWPRGIDCEATVSRLNSGLQQNDGDCASPAATTVADNESSCVVAAAHS